MFDKYIVFTPGAIKSGFFILSRVGPLLENSAITSSFKSGVRLSSNAPTDMTCLQYSGSGSPDKIVSLEEPFVYTGGGARCSFQGNMVYKLISGREFYTLIQGDAYSTGTMKVSGGVKINLGGRGEATITISNGSGYLENISYQETYYSSALDE